mmetsp:Transcript_33363/g.66394  ORF Transcript_33363/g.66394 Transcript_33363/m.66394 type:complete len:265 (-) Transcript_33363:529-1323(-)
MAFRSLSIERSIEDMVSRSRSSRCLRLPAETPKTSRGTGRPTTGEGGGAGGCPCASPAALAAVPAATPAAAFAALAAAAPVAVVLPAAAPAVARGTAGTSTPTGVAAFAFAALAVTPAPSAAAASPSKGPKEEVGLASFLGDPVPGESPPEVRELPRALHVKEGAVGLRLGMGWTTFGRLGGDSSGSQSSKTSARSCTHLLVLLLPSALHAQSSPVPWPGRALIRQAEAGRVRLFDSIGGEVLLELVGGVPTVFARWSSLCLSS